MKIDTFDKIEYYSENIPNQGIRLLEKLNELGKLGWEYLFNEGSNYYFKRVIRNSF